MWVNIGIHSQVICIQSLSLGYDSAPSYVPPGKWMWVPHGHGVWKSLLLSRTWALSSPWCWKSAAVLGLYPRVHHDAVRTWCGHTYMHSLCLCVRKPTSVVMVKINICTELCCLQKSSLYVCFYIFYSMILGHQLLFILSSLANIFLSTNVYQVSSYVRLF